MDWVLAHLPDILRIAGGVLAAFYLLAPAIVYLVQRQPAHPTFVPVAPEDREFLLPPDATRYLAEQDGPLRAAGFEPLGTLHQDGEQKRPTIYVTLYRNDRAQDLAIAAVLWFQDQARSCHVEFSTGLDGDALINTSNASVLAAYAPAPGRVTTQLPRMDDPARLYRVHRFLVDDLAGPSAKRRLPPEREPSAILREAVFRELLSQVETGYFALDEAADEFRPTIKGAFLMTWGLLPPAANLRRLARDRRAARILAEAERA